MVRTKCQQKWHFVRTPIFLLVSFESSLMTIWYFDFEKMAEQISFHSALCHSPDRNKNSSLFPSAINCNGTPPGGDGPVPVELNLYTSFQPSLRSHGTSRNHSEPASKSQDSPNLSRPPLTKLITLVEEKMMFFCISGGPRLMLQSHIQTPSPSFWKMVMMIMILF